MHRGSRRLRALAAACCAVAGLLGPFVAAASDSRCVAPKGCLAWAATYNPPGNAEDNIQALAVSPDGLRVFAAGYGTWPGGEDHALLAYDAISGQRLWVARYDGGSFDFPHDVHVSPDGSLVYLVGWSQSEGVRKLFARAHDALTGQQVWIREHAGPTVSPPGGNYPTWHADKSGLSPDGATLYVPGSEEGDIIVLVLDAATGELLRTLRHSAGSQVEPRAFGIAPDGRRFFVTGSQQRQDFTTDYMTAAFDAASGTVLWTATYGGPLNLRDRPASLAVAPDGSRVYVTGISDGNSQFDPGANYATVAYDAGTGETLWTAIFTGLGAGDQARSVAASPWGDLIYVTGISWDNESFWDAVTVAYDAATGSQEWLARFEGNNEWEWGNELRVAPGGHRVYVAGIVTVPIPFFRSNFLTLAYDATTGAQVWEQEWNMVNLNQDEAYVLTLAPAGDRLYVGGYSYAGTYKDFAAAGYGPLTIAPSAVLVAQPTTGEAPLTVTFVLAGADADGVVDGWRLDVDGDHVADYQSATGFPPPVLTHTYQSPGSYTVSLTVSDDHGAIGTDEVEITVTGTVSVETPGPVSFALHGVRPNPATRYLNVSFSLAGADPATLELFDVRGRLVLAEEVGTLGPGFHEVTLAARERLSPGLYLIRLSQDGSALSTKAVIVD